MPAFAHSISNKTDPVMAYNSDGARSRTRTGTALLPRDFKSLVSTNFTTRANPCVERKERGNKGA